MIDKVEQSSRRWFLKGGLALTASIAINTPPFDLTRNLLSKTVPAQALETNSPANFALIVPGSFPGSLEGRFYTETRGNAPYPKGFTVINDKQAQVWSEFKKFGGVEVWGYPISNRWIDDAGRVCQAFQRGIFQFTTDNNGKTVNVEWLNIFDELSKRGKDDWLEKIRQTPMSPLWKSDEGKNWKEIVDNHLAILDQNLVIKKIFLTDPLWLQKYGLPMAMKDYGNQVSLRCQRAVFQQWKIDTPWAKTGQVVMALGGDIAKEAGGIIPQETAIPIDPPANRLEIVQYDAPLVFKRGDPNQALEALTVDDGWSTYQPYLERIINIADGKGARLTFFLIGSEMLKYPDLVKQIWTKGHRIGNHTFNHPRLSTLSEADIRWQIRRHNEITRLIIGESYTPQFLRPPFGDGIFNYDPRIVRIAQEEGLKIAMWTEDNRNNVNRTITNLANGSIILQHANPNDAPIFPQLIDGILKKGFRLVTLPEAIKGLR